jgi:hypothetical protein
MKNHRVKIKIFLIVLLFLSTAAITLFQPSLQVLAQDSNNIEALEQKEKEREEDFLNQLLLEIPTQTDNPSHIITFVDPSETNAGVQLEIDEKGFEPITSPYALPALGIGRHELRFRFVDKYGSTQILEQDIIVIPRPPIINSPVFQEEFLQISGTGLSNSELILILSSERRILVEETTIDDDGNWQLQINNEELKEGIFTFTAFTRKYGHASNLAEATTFEIGESNGLTFNNTKEIYFSFEDLSIDDIGTVLSQNLDLGLLVGGAFVLGFLISLLIFSVVKSSIDNKTVRVFEKKIHNRKNKKELTLKERLSQQKKEEGEEETQETTNKQTSKSEDNNKEVKKDSKKKRKKVKKKQKKEDKEKKNQGKKKKKKNKTEVILTKVDFLKDYKKFDPDDDEGKEKDNIEINVTSKK